MTACALPDAGDDCDHPALFTESWRKARKEHRCSECRREIPVGAKYQHIRGLWNGSWSTIKTCAVCVELRGHFYYGSYIYGALWTDLQEYLFPDMRAGGECMQGLSPAAKGLLFERRLEWLGIEPTRSE